MSVKLPLFLKVLISFVTDWLMKELREELEEGICFTGKPIPKGYRLCIHLEKRQRNPADKRKVYRL